MMAGIKIPTKKDTQKKAQKLRPFFDAARPTSGESAVFIPATPTMRTTCSWSYGVTALTQMTSPTTVKTGSQTRPGILTGSTKFPPSFSNDGGYRNKSESSEMNYIATMRDKPLRMAAKCNVADSGVVPVNRNPW
jgi:hypothetical protein